MSSIQFDYSTLSTSVSRSELNSIVGHNYVIDNNYIGEETNSEVSSDSVEAYVHPTPPDKYKLVYLTFGLLGIGALLPWNIFITANDFWMYKFRSTANNSCIDIHNKTDLQAYFTSYLSIANNVPYVTFLVLCTVFNHKFSKMFRVFGSLVVTFLLFAIITAFVEIDTDSWQTLFFSITMLLVVVISITSALLQAGVAAIASLLPSKYMHIMVLGQAFAGIFASMAQTVSLLGHCDSVKSALVYFFCADIVIIFALLSYIGIQKSEFFKYHVLTLKDTAILKDVSEPEVKAKLSIVLILKAVWPYAIAILLDFWVTIGVFPGLAVLAVSESHGQIWNEKLFLPLTCFLLFNISDFCGRAIAGWVPWPAKWRIQFLGFSALRIVFIPLFMLCNIYPRYHLPIVFASDIYYIAFITLLGFSNGYIIAVAMMLGIKSVNILLQEMTGVVLSTCLGAGLMLGSISSYLFIKIL